MKRFVETNDQIDRLKTSLANSRISASNNALYQTIFNLIDRVKQVNTDTNTRIESVSGGGSGGGGGTTIITNNNGGPVSRLVGTGETITIADTFCLIVVDYYHVIGTLNISGDGVLKVIPA